MRPSGSSILFSDSTGSVKITGSIDSVTMNIKFEESDPNKLGLTLNSMKIYIGNITDKSFSFLSHSPNAVLGDSDFTLQ